MPAEGSVAVGKPGESNNLVAVAGRMLQIIAGAQFHKQFDTLLLQQKIFRVFDGYLKKLPLYREHGLVVPVDQGIFRVLACLFVAGKRLRVIAK